MKMYGELAEWWPLLSPPENYRDEARFFGELILKSRLPASPQMLELGCGGGNNAFYLKPLFTNVILTDASAAMLAVSCRLNPECEHIQGDMRKLRLKREFDVVFVHDAIGYMTTESELKAVFDTAFIHCKPGGMALFVPDFVRETFQSATSHGGSDSDERGFRYLEWVYDPDTADSTYEMAFCYMMREGAGRPKMKSEVHVLGLFTASEWMEWMRNSGFQPETVMDPYDREVFVGRKDCR